MNRFGRPGRNQISSMRSFLPRARAARSMVCSVTEGEYGAVISRACLLRLYELEENAAELLRLLKVGVVT